MAAAIEMLPRELIDIHLAFRPKGNPDAVLTLREKGRERNAFDAQGVIDHAFQIAGLIVETLHFLYIQRDIGGAVFRHHDQFLMQAIPQQIHAGSRKRIEYGPVDTHGIGSPVDKFGDNPEQTGVTAGVTERARIGADTGIEAGRHPFVHQRDIQFRRNGLIQFFTG